MGIQPLVRLLVVGMLITAAAVAGATSAAPGVTTRVSVDSAGNQGVKPSGGPVVSDDGRYVAFDSSSSNLVPGDTNTYPDVFVHDRQTGETTRVSVDSAGNEADYGSNRPAISADGRYVAFISWAWNLVSGDTNSMSDVFVHDRQTGETTRVSVNSDGNQGNGPSQTLLMENYTPVISGDGRYVAFVSMASNLVPGDTNTYPDVFVHDRQTGETTRVSVDSAGNQGDSLSDYPAISADGRYVAFISFASNLVSGDTNSSGDIFVHDRQTGETTRVSVDSAGVQGNEISEYGVAVSGDGRYVAFSSMASNLVSGDTNMCGVIYPRSCRDIFVHDRQTGETTRVSVDSAGNQGDEDSAYPHVSAGGRYVTFRSEASNLVPGDTNYYCETDGDADYDDNCPDIFVHDRQTGETTRVSVDNAGNQGNAASISPTLSAAGRYVAFSSESSNLVPGDTNDQVDVFIHDREASADPTPAPVGGIAEFVDMAGSAGGSSPLPYGTLAGFVAAVAVVLAVGGWYARRRWLR